MEVKENQELTKQQHMNLFRAIIKAYGVAASYGYQRKMAIDHPLCDFFGVFVKSKMQFSVIKFTYVNIIFSFKKAFSPLMS